VNKLKTLKGAVLVAATSMLPLSQAAMAEVSISGWINEGIQFYDDGATSDAVATSDNGTTLGSRITFAASSEVATGLTAGMEVILEPLSNNTPLIFSNQTAGPSLGAGGAFGDTTGDVLLVLGSSLHIGGAWGKITAGLQSMPTDNIAVLEDPSLTLWSGISPVFRGNGFTINNAAGSLAGAVWGNFLSCFGAAGLRGVGGIGIDCNGIYRQGIRYDLPAFGPVTIAIGYANDDVYDIAAKWKGSLGRMTGQVALGYSINQGINAPGLAAGTATVTAAASAAFFTGTGAAADVLAYTEAETFQIQAGLMDPVTGLFGSIAYQNEDADLVTGAQATMNAVSPIGGTISDSSDAWWLKVGIKKKWFAAGDTSISFDYGQYNDQYGVVQAALGVTGSEVERIGVALDQYFGSSLIIYGKWEQLDLDLDTTAASNAAYNGFYGTTLGGDADELDTFTLGATYFF
jgi:hypothetical protein